MSSRLENGGRLATLLVPALAGLAASSMLLVDYLRPSPLFCEEGGGCDVLKQTAYAGLFGVPTPAFGVLAFLVFGALALVRAAWARSALLLASSIGAGVALFLLSVQVRFGVYCTFCMVADTAMVLVSVAAALRFKSKWDLPPGVLSRAASGGLLAVAALAPLAVGVLKKPTIPAPIAEELDRTPKGKITVVDFVDFECPWCRAMNESLEPVLAEHKDRLRVVRKQVPLRMHPHALDAARAACCGEQLGNGDAMASALFKADDLTPAGCEKIAKQLGLDLDAYRKCVSDPSTDARIRADSESFRSSKGHGLPTIWIGEQKLEGAQDKGAIERALGDALAHAGS